jgi:hypothetical protein
MRTAGELAGVGAATPWWPQRRGGGAGGRGGERGRRPPAGAAGEPGAAIADALALAALPGEDDLPAGLAAVSTQSAADAMTRAGARAVAAQARLGAASVRRLIAGGSA